MEKDFLHKINLEQLQREVKKSVVEIGKLVDMKNPNGVYKWAKSQEENGSRPSYNSLIKLLKEGATVKTLFGIEPKDATDSYCNVPDEFNSPEFKAGVAMAIKEMKEKGLIK